MKTLIHRSGHDDVGVGDVVLYVPAAPYELHAHDAPRDWVPLAAIVTAVAADGTASLHVYGPSDDFRVHGVSHAPIPTPERWTRKPGDRRGP